jgi:flagellar hook protein FlgE
MVLAMVRPQGLPANPVGDEVMGIFGALTAAVTGLRAQSYALENVAGNIANSQTTAFKRVDTSFEDMIGDASPSKQVAGSIVASSRSTNSVQGAIQNASVGTFMAINGDGFFVVEKPASFADGQPTFEGGELYTRRGDFQLDKNGFLVNGAGYYLLGNLVDPTTGNMIGNVPQIVKLQNDLLPAQSTTQIQYHANLPSYPLTSAHDTAVPGSELLAAATLTAGNVTGANETTFLNQSISGGAVTSYDALGAPVNVQLRWGKTNSVANGGNDTWNLFYQTNSTATGAQVAWQNVGVNYVFGPGGQLNPPISSLTISNLTVDGISLGSVDLVHGTGITQFADTKGSVQVNQLEQNGFAAGTLQSVSVSDKGHIVGSYSNGRSIDLAEITLAKFNGSDFLKRLDGGAFEQTDESGPAIFGAAGKILGASLEGSNADVADEFTKLIVTQQAYSANTKVITTGNQMVQDLLNMLR